MSRAAPRQIDYQRMIRALKAEGVPVEKIVESVIVRVFGPLREPPTPSPDQDLDDELEAWRRKNANG